MTWRNRKWQYLALASGKQREEENGESVMQQ